MKIYTKSGDTGQTGLFTGQRVPKTHPRIEAFGDIDELNSQLGAARASAPAADVDKSLSHIQHDLFGLGADLAACRDILDTLQPGAVAWLEEGIDEMTAQLPPLKQFILPGGNPAASRLHVARTVCRRAERRTIALSELEPVPSEAIVYLNRLSDFLFTLARFENHLRGFPEPVWVPRRTAD